MESKLLAYLKEEAKKIKCEVHGQNPLVDEKNGEIFMFFCCPDFKKQGDTILKEAGNEYIRNNVVVEIKVQKPI